MLSHLAKEITAVAFSAPHLVCRIPCNLIRELSLNNKLRVRNQGTVQIKNTLGDLEDFVSVTTGFALGVDFLFGFGFEKSDNYNNPYLTTRQKNRRAFVSGVGSTGFALGGSVLVTSIGCGPYVLICAVGGGIAGGGIWNYFQPVIFQSFGLEPVRNLGRYRP